jgi:hypothetical protein
VTAANSAVRLTTADLTTANLASDIAAALGLDPALVSAGRVFDPTASFSVRVRGTCVDGVRNGDETRADCGGSCGPCMEQVARAAAGTALAAALVAVVTAVAMAAIYCRRHRARRSRDRERETEALIVEESQQELVRLKRRLNDAEADIKRWEDLGVPVPDVFREEAAQLRKKTAKVSEAVAKREAAEETNRRLAASRRKEKRKQERRRRRHRVKNHRSSSSLL